MVITLRCYQGTCKPLTLVKALAGYLQTSDTGQDTKETI